MPDMHLVNQSTNTMDIISSVGDFFNDKLDSIDNAIDEFLGIDNDDEIVEKATTENENHQIKNDSKYLQN